ncbi:MAG: formamidopyrimidine-DNA glycosylase [Ectothiorhodospiraceae bacterium]|nr:formamidopyrimidine-DNA glycosylase [Ectothiorhodospiraceae bacterium]
MPELPDVTVYVERLAALTCGTVLRGVRLRSPFVLRTIEPSPSDAAGRSVLAVRRLGKRIVIDLEGDLHLVLHLMIAGRLRWRPIDAPVPASNGLAAFDFDRGTVLFTESGSRKRASLHVVSGEDGVGAFDRGGLEVMNADTDAFAAALRRENHTLKRALTDPRILSGIGNAYSDEILHAARLSPFRQTSKLDDEAVARLHQATRDTLRDWTARLRAETGDRFPDKVTAFRPGMAVHGRFREPCPACGTAVQRIVYAGSESNYCPRCQTEGRILSDRSLSRLLKQSWPRTVEELEQ